MIQEGELEFDFDAARSFERFDEQGVPIPVGMKLVDFVVEEANRIFLIEVKDPSDREAQEAARREFGQSMHGDELINGKLVPKARDSYAFLHLMERDRHPFIFVVVLGLERLSNEKALLLSFKDRLIKRIRHEAKEPWKKAYIADCVVVTPDTWKAAFPRYGLARRKSGATS